MQVPEPEQIPFYIKATAEAGWDEVFDNNSFLPTDILYKFYQGNTPKGRWYIKINGVTYYLSPDNLYQKPHRTYLTIRYSLKDFQEFFGSLDIDLDDGNIILSISPKTSEEFTEQMTVEVIKWVDE